MTDTYETPETPEAEDTCGLCPCADCPGTDPDSTAELAEHSKACSTKHF